MRCRATTCPPRPPAYIEPPTIAEDRKGWLFRTVRTDKADILSALVMNESDAWSDDPPTRRRRQSSRPSAGGQFDLGHGGRVAPLVHRHPQATMDRRDPHRPTPQKLPNVFLDAVENQHYRATASTSFMGRCEEPPIAVAAGLQQVDHERMAQRMRGDRACHPGTLTCLPTGALEREPRDRLPRPLAWEDGSPPAVRSRDTRCSAAKSRAFVSSSGTSCRRRSASSSTAIGSRR
jgi:hypothetical protein